MKIVFFGSSHFAVSALQALIDKGEDIICVVTQPDKKKGRHLHLSKTDVKTVALESGLKVYQPQDINTKESKEFLTSLSSDLFVIVAYGQLLSQEILDIPKIMPINIHASLLPKYRGAAPINWAIINGDKTTGVTIMKVTKKMDSGPIILQKSVQVSDLDTFINLEDGLRSLGSELLLEAISLIKNKKFKLIPQDESKVSFAAKLKKRDGGIDWDKPAVKIYNLIHGTLPWPGAFTHYKGKLLKIFNASVITDLKNEAKPGEVIQVSKSGLIIATGKDCLKINELQIEGKRKMNIEEFIAGHKIKVGEKLSCN